MSYYNYYDTALGCIVRTNTADPDKEEIPDFNHLTHWWDQTDKAVKLREPVNYGMEFSGYVGDSIYLTNLPEGCVVHDGKTDYVVTSAGTYEKCVEELGDGRLELRGASFISCTVKYTAKLNPALTYVTNADINTARDKIVSSPLCIDDFLFKATLLEEKEIHDWILLAKSKGKVATEWGLADGFVTTFSLEDMEYYLEQIILKRAERAETVYQEAYSFRINGCTQTELDEWVITYTGALL